MPLSCLLFSFIKHNVVKTNEKYMMSFLTSVAPEVLSLYNIFAASFQWADEKFPICEGHGKRAVLRTVLKQGPNNGRKFFACPLAKKKQCGFFEWTEDIE